MYEKIVYENIFQIVYMDNYKRIGDNAVKVQLKHLI
jgi:hypothetical protein